MQSTPNSFCRDIDLFSDGGKRFTGVLVKGKENLIIQATHGIQGGSSRKEPAIICNNSDFSVLKLGRRSKKGHIFFEATN